VVSAEDGVQVARDFLLPRSGLFASVDDLQKLNKELDSQRKKAVGKALSLGLEDDDEEQQKVPSFAELKEKFLGGKSATLEAAKDRYPDGFFQAKDGKTLVVLVRTGITTGELQLSREALAKVKEVVQKTLPDAGGKGFQIGYAGDLVTAREYLSASLQHDRGTGNTAQLSAGLRNLAECLGRLGLPGPAAETATAAHSAIAIDTTSIPPCAPFGQKTCHAKKTARFTMTPTTAAVIPERGAVNLS